MERLFVVCCYSIALFVCAIIFFSSLVVSLFIVIIALIVDFYIFTQLHIAQKISHRQIVSSIYPGICLLTQFTKAKLFYRDNASSSQKQSKKHHLIQLQTNAEVNFVANFPTHPCCIFTFSHFILLSSLSPSILLLIHFNRFTRMFNVHMRANFLFFFPFIKYKMSVCTLIVLRVFQKMGYSLVLHENSEFYPENEKYPTPSEIPLD